MKTTLEDVAKAAGVSKSLVSKCLAGAPDARMREETRKRIEEAVRKCHYLPSRLAQSLKKGRSRTIGLVISDLRNPFWAALADFALREAKKFHYRLLISLCEFCPQEELEHLRTLIEYRVDGVLYCERLGDFEWKETLLEEHFPMMLMFQNSSTFPSASADYREALAGAVKHLAGHGCRELLCLHSGESEWPRILRSECRRAGLRFSVRSAPLNPEELGAFLDRICREAPPALLLNGWRTGLMLVQRMEEFFPRYRPELILNSHFDHPAFLNDRITGLVRNDLENLVRRSIRNLIVQIEGGRGENPRSEAEFLTPAELRRRMRELLPSRFPY